MQGIIAKSVQLFSALSQQFPGFPKTRARALPRLLCILFIFISAAIFAEAHPFLRALGFETIWFQFTGAALLWWEANAVQKIELVVEELRLLIPGRETKGEHVLRIIGNIIVAAIWVIAILVVASEFWLLSLKDDFYVRSINTLKVISGLLLTATAIYGGARWIDRQFVKVALAIAKADARGEVGEPQQKAARSLLRTIGFALVAIGTLLQIPPVAVQEWP